MKKISLIVCLLLAAAVLLAAAPGTERAQKKEFHYEADFSANSLGEVLEVYLAEKKLTERNVSVGWCDLDSGEEWYFGGDTFMEGGSSYKLPLAMLYTDMIAAGEVSPDDRVGSYTVQSAIESALINSNNAAGQMLHRRLGVGTEEYRTMIARYCRIDPEELPSGYYTANQFSARYLVGTLRTLYENADRYGMLIDCLKQARQNDYLCLYIDGTEIAHKYGSYDIYLCDSGIVYAEKPFVISVMTRGIGGAGKIIGEIGRIALDYAEYCAAHEKEDPAPEQAAETTPEPTPDSTIEEAAGVTPLPTISPEPLPTPESVSVPAGPSSSEQTARNVLLVSGTASALVAVGLLLRKKKR